MKGGMPLYKHMSNRFLTFIDNLVLGIKLPACQTGFRVFSRGAGDIAV